MRNTFNPKVSIVIPVYNGSNYVKEAIDSALAQTYKSIEVIVINDGSNDKGKTDKICKSYGNRIRYFKKENGGVSSALNMGIEKMEGEYFSWLSHDDVYYPNKIEKQIKYLSELEDSKKVVLYADYELINEKSESTGKVILNHKELTEKPEYALLRGSVNGITLLIPKSAFDKYGNFNESLKVTQDYDMWRRIMKTYKFIHMDDIFTKTRIHALQDSNKHPNIATEGGKLWISMIESVEKKRKEELEGSEYTYYTEMIRFLKNTPYVGALEFVKHKQNQIYHNVGGKNDKTLISVIIPFYNRVSLLKNAIDSVLLQTHINFEVILVNDGSTEDISDIIEYENKDKRIRMLHSQRNRGAAHSRNMGIDDARGEYLAFLDSDDRFLPEKLETQVKIMNLTKYDVSHTSYIRLDGEIESVIPSGQLIGEVIPSIIANCPIATPTIMIKTEYLKKNKFKFQESIQIGEDTCFWLEILRDTKLFGIEEPLTIVNVNEKSSAINPVKHLEGLTNILGYILTDKEYSKYNQEISIICQRYIETSVQIESSGILKGPNKVNRFSWDKFHKLIYLFKYQGIPLTIKKIIWKYVPRAINKVKRVFNGNR